MAQGIQLHNPAVRDVPGVRDEHILPPKLLRRSERDPMRLYTRVLIYLDHLFSIHNITYLSGQRELLADATEAVLQAVPGTVTAIPFQPGLGKSTLIRALLAVMAQEFQDRTSIAQAIGGVIVVVEKTAEAEELETLCNTHRTERPVAKAVFSPNDYNLALGRCINGTAQSYSECPGRSCRDYALCPLVQSARQTHSTPILIISHARYQHYMENMSALLPWEDESGQYIRTLLLVDELPQLTEDNVMNLRTINQFESMFDQLKPSYQAQLRKAKSTLLYLWHDAIRSPFFRLLHSAPEHCSLFGTVSQQELETAGFTEDRLQKLRNTIVNYTGTEDCGSVHLVDVLLAAKAAYYAVGQDTSFFFPRLKALHGETQPATFLFSGTASLSPELFRNPNIHTFPDKNLESFQRLQINIQRGDLFNSSKSGLEKQQNLNALIAWLHFVLPQISERHKRILVVTYKRYAESLWEALEQFHNVLISYIGADKQIKPMLPYFGGLNGSNLYRESTCVICLGLNRFEPRDYVSRTLALDVDGTFRGEISTNLEMQGGTLRLDSLPSVMDMQDITLAREIVQMVFRSALRNHGGTEPIELWLLQPPNGVIGYLQSYFVDGQIQEISELPTECQLAVAKGKTYMGEQTHAAKVLEFLVNLPLGRQVTPEQIREATGLAPNQFKEARKHKAVRTYFKEYIQTTGSGQNTVYEKLWSDPRPSRETVSA